VQEKIFNLKVAEYILISDNITYLLLFDIISTTRQEYLYDMVPIQMKFYSHFFFIEVKQMFLHFRLHSSTQL
jgi:hypothetical protein